MVFSPLSRDVCVPRTLSLGLEQLKHASKNENCGELPQKRKTEVGLRHGNMNKRRGEKKKQQKVTEEPQRSESTAGHTGTVTDASTGSEPKRRRPFPKRRIFFSPRTHSLSAYVSLPFVDAKHKSKTSTNISHTHMHELQSAQKKKRNCGRTDVMPTDTKRSQHACSQRSKGHQRGRYC